MGRQAIPKNWCHLSIDMQRIFAEDTPWHVEWMGRIADQVVEITSRHADRTVFTRFIPPEQPEDLPGKWEDYYRKWRSVTRDRMPADLFGLIHPLERFVPPARLFDKYTYSPWHDGRLHAALQRDGINTVVVTGGEADVCVLAAVLGAIDYGYAVILLKDAICSSTDQTYDASLTLMHSRFSVQLDVVTTEDFLSSL
jgi:nicotinamidase-related amidase